MPPPARILKASRIISHNSEITYFSISRVFFASNFVKKHRSSLVEANSGNVMKHKANYFLLSVSDRISEIKNDKHGRYSVESMTFWLLI